jgi:ABC-type branched-subunit amino acid transport system permease subunit
MALLTTYAGWPLVITVPVAMTASVVGALIIAIPTLQLRRIYFAVAAIAFSQIVQSLLINQDEITQGTRGVLGYDGAWRDIEAFIITALNNLGWGEPDPKVPIVIVTWTIALVIALLLRWLVRSPWGRTMRAVREDPDAARSLGKPVLRQRIIAVSIGAAIAGLAGVFYAFDTGIIYPNFFDVSLTFLAFTMLIVGGAGAPLGTLVGTLIISVVYAGPRLLDLPLSAGQVGALRLVVIGLLLIAVIVFRPQGLFGRRQEMLFEDE